MKDKTIWIVIGCILFSLMLFFHTGQTITATAATKAQAAGKNWWDKFGKPQYGGTINFASARFNDKLDAYSYGYAAHMYFLEPLGIPDWALDRKIWAFPSPFVPMEYYQGLLAESWEIPDTNTVIFRIRKDIKWQDKEPVNGRQFTADDVVFHYDRFLGTGSGFTKPSAFHIRRMSNIQKATARDKYTVVIKFKQSSALNLSSILDQDGRNFFEAPEVIKKYGDALDWQNAVGTGPWILTGYVSDSTLTFSKNPDYWGYDERYPKNKLPYADTLKVMNIKDLATRIAALRSGRIDFADEISLQQAQTLAQRKSKLQQAKLPFISSHGVDLRVDNKPFTDIRVRKALQMAIDRKTIAATYFKGTVDGIPCGGIYPGHKGYCYPYEQWSRQLKGEYSYNPKRAKQLLAEAGYPKGFKTEIYADNSADKALLQAIKSYFKDIGVDMEIKQTADIVTFNDLIHAKKINQMAWNRNTGSTAEPHVMVRMNYSNTPYNFNNVNDPTYDALCDKQMASTDMNEIKKLDVQLDKYTIEHHWSVRLFPINVYSIWQEWLKGYSGENMLRMGSPAGWPWARFWIDQKLKK